jgi:hypothetical protein
MMSRNAYRAKVYDIPRCLSKLVTAPGTPKANGGPVRLGWLRSLWRHEQAGGRALGQRNPVQASADRTVLYRLSPLSRDPYLNHSA